MAPSKRPRRRARDIDHIHLARQALNILGRAFKQKRIANPHHKIVKLAADILVPPVHGQRINPVAPPQAHAAKRAAHHLAARRDQNLDGAGFNRRDLIDPLEAFVTLQAEQFGHLRAQNDAVADLKRHTAQVAAQRLIAPDHVDKAHPLAFEKLHPGHFAPDQVAVRRDHRLGEKLHPRAIRQHIGHAVAHRQQERPEKPQVNRAPDHQDDAKRRDLEDGEGLHALGARDPVHKQVGRGADQGGRAAKNGRVTEWNQKLADRDLKRARQLHEHRDHHHDHGRVVHEGRGHDHRHQ